MNGNVKRTIERLIASGVISEAPLEFVDKINGLGITVLFGVS